MIIGASLKTYFSHARTLTWVSEVAAILDEHPARNRVAAFVAPQFPSIPGALERAGRLVVGAQDLAVHDTGAYTGEVSGAVLAELGCRYAEVGHAERRRLFGETESVVSAKTHAALRNGLTPVVCVGEEDEAGIDAAIATCAQQVRSALADADEAGASGAVVIAYEPLWAIGAPAPATSEHIRSVCSGLRSRIDDADREVSIIYGGSAGPGLLSTISDAVDGLFLGRFAHDPRAVRDILDEVEALSG
ncbi:triose-phosphate isomerase [Microbacterium sp. H37-C3]|uniref:triose-phosphate isomerase family protein n=1 Tax=Microbacterium sp. H37-C3 TaxID=3004354 RepID=UPI0022AEAAAB|nr:triose-phosphate isomerase family protein [Microbacterium sp. H37-C3]MCZ4067155.1 triose-phosphate isomerase [Microbacterium sp. H37-C3]